MSNKNFSYVLKKISSEFHEARNSPLKDHPLAKIIRKDFSNIAYEMVEEKYREKLKFSSSPGAGQWNSAPWLAILHKNITSSAQMGYYPVYLFEPGFKTVCLVMGQGAERLEQAVGKAYALIELGKRAGKLRDATNSWVSAGFIDGSFKTARDAAVMLNDQAKVDPWAIAVAFGKRYNIAALPSDEELALDLNRMIKIYCELIDKRVLGDLAIDRLLADMVVTGEMPEIMNGSIDGAKRVAYHKNFEYRYRNKSLIKRVKKLLGSTCQACSFKFSELYGNSMMDFIEAHHSKPISEISENGDFLQPSAEHFMVLCSNCHRAIHAAGCPDLLTFKASLLGRINLLK